MDQRNPYGMPPPGSGRNPLQNGMQVQRPPGMLQQQQQHYMSEMMFDPMAMPMGNGLYSHPGHGHPAHNGYHPHAHPGHRGMGGHMGGVHHPGMMSPEEDPRFVDDIVSALGPGDLGDPVGMGDQHHMGQIPMQVYDQPHIIPPSQHQVRAQGVPPMSQTPPQQQAPLQAPASMVPAVSVGMGNMGGAIARRQQHPPPAQSVTSSSLMPPTALVPASKSTSSVDSRALTTGSNNGSSDDELLGDDDNSKKKERRRQQVRYASRRRRKKQKDEESFLRDRIEELKEQIRIIGGDLSEQCSQMAGMSEQALTEAYEKQMQTVQTLRKDNNKLKEQLLQHENFARMIQYGLNALPSDCRDVDRKKIPGVPMWFSDQMNPLKGPTLVVDLNLCHEAVRQAYNELKSFGPSVHSKTNICYAMGWKTELWATGTCLSFKAVRSISDKNIREVANSSWDIITSPDKYKRIYPDVKQFRILQKVTDDIVVTHRIASVASDLSDREFISVAFRFRDENNYYIGIKSIAVQTECAENCIRGDECQGWMFTGSEDETAQWKAHFLGYYDVKGDKDDKVLNQLANEAMFGMLRWESEAMHPLSV
ncbi:hypothetical protein PybrP1_002301 [[Pythium] brassicae (nom. inval.)]|nr:hypothetical protein PybrP1_002301 [[Pythium] brassicae (nom. inval.)]